MLIFIRKHLSKKNKMAQLINEVKRFQKLAGILKEAKLNPEQSKAIQDAKSALSIISRIASLDTVAREAIQDVLNNILPTISGLDESLNEEEQEVSPEQAAAEVAKTASKIEQSPVIDKIAADIAKDPKALKQLQSVLNQAGVNPAELSENIDSSIIKKLALNMANKAEKISETLSEEEGFDSGGALLSGLVGGGTLAYYMAKAGDVLTQHQILMGHSPSHMIETVIGAIAGAILAVIGKKVYDKMSNK